MAGLGTECQDEKWVRKLAMHEFAPPTDDGLDIPEVGAWSRDKHHFLRRYLDAFTTAMKGKRWDGLHYIDLFAGAGIERIKETDELEWGSPLIAAKLRFPFSRLHVVEHKPKKFEALEKRLGDCDLSPSAQCLCGDCNDKVREIVNEVPKGSLSVAFLDPFGLDLQFHTVDTLAKRRVDLIIYFPDFLDMVRNRKLYVEKTDSKLDAFLGSRVDWKSAIKDVPQDELASVFYNLYSEQLRRLGYGYIDAKRIYKKGTRRLYKLVFCSRDEAGGRIWRKISLKGPDAQRSFDFPD